jgi:heme a synthase
MRSIGSMTRRMSMLRTMAIACAVLVLAITTLSAFIRLSREAAACQPWPQCRSAQVQPAGDAPVPAGAVVAARIAHRIAASAVLLLIIGMLMVSHASQPVLREPGRLVLALLGLAVFLAVLGRMGGESRAPAVVIGNLVAGFTLFAVSCRLAALLGAGARRAAPAAGAWAWSAVALLLLQIALGAAAGAARGGGLPRLLHQVASILVAAVLLPLGFFAWRRGLGSGAGVAVLVLLELAGGGLLVLSPPSLGLALAHNVLGALLLAALVDVAAGARRHPVPEAGAAARRRAF